MPPRNQPKSLLQISTSFLNTQIWNTTNAHANSGCKYCTIPVPNAQCSYMKKIKEDISIVPFDALRQVQANWEKLLTASGEYRVSQNVDNENLDGRMLTTRLRYLLYNLLHGNSRLEITDFCLAYYEDFHFLKKFGKCIRQIHFMNMRYYRDFGESGIYDYIASVEDPSTWLLALRSMENVLVVNLLFVSVTGNLLQVIGKECNQIKVLRNITLMKGITSEDFLKLCYVDHMIQTEKNNCCRTLEAVEFWTSAHSIKCVLKETCPHEILSDPQVLAGIYHVLLVNLVNLKFIGDDFHLDQYLSYYDDMDLIDHDVQLTAAYSDKMDQRVIGVFRKYFTRCDTLSLKVNQTVRVWSELSQLPNLETLKIYEIHQDSDVFIYDGMLASKWPNLKCFYTSCYLHELNLSVFAENCPKLESIEIDNEVSVVEWDGVRKFKCLEYIGVPLDFLNVNSLHWMASFAETIQSVMIYSYHDDVLNVPTCKILTSVPFPKLRDLSISCLECDSNFLRNVLVMCPQLQEFGSYEVCDSDTLKLEVDLKAQNFKFDLIECY